MLRKKIPYVLRGRTLEKPKRGIKMPN